MKNKRRRGRKLHGWELYVNNIACGLIQKCRYMSIPKFAHYTSMKHFFWKVASVKVISKNRFNFSTLPESRVETRKCHFTLTFHTLFLCIKYVPVESALSILKREGFNYFLYAGNWTGRAMQDVEAPNNEDGNKRRNGANYVIQRRHFLSIQIHRKQGKRGWTRKLNVGRWIWFSGHY